MTIFILAGQNARKAKPIYLVGVGDSIMAGHPGNFTAIEGGGASGINIPEALAGLRGWTFINNGIGSQTTAQISARFTRDVVNLRPRRVIINGGVNDIALGVTKSTFLANWQTMLETCAQNGIAAIAMLIAPWTNGTNGQMTTRDDWNASLRTLAAGYPRVAVFDASATVGQFRPTGTAGNLWDIQTAYNSDGVHFTQPGYTALAAAINLSF